MLTITKPRNRLLDSATKAVLLIESWMSHPESDRWGMERDEKAEDVVEDAGSMSDAESLEF
jgi:allophanate hydrolase subunit 2